MLLYNSLLKWYNKRPEDKFATYENKFYSVTDIFFEVESVSIAMHDLKDKKNNRVILFLKNPIDIIISYLACNKLNITPIIINSDWGYDEISNAINNIEVDFVLSDWDCSKVFKNKKIDQEVYFMEEILRSSKGCGIKPNFKNISNNIECILFTSGTSGIPKAIELSSDNFLESTRIWEKEITFNRDDNYVLCLPLHHISGLAIVYRALLNNFKITVLNSLNELLDIEANPSIISVVPAMIKSMFNNEELLQKMKSMRAIILGGEMMDKKIVYQCIKYNLKIFISYGLTETCSGICGYWVDSNSYIENSSGKAFDDVKISIDDNGNIIITSKTVMRGYLGQPISNGRIETNDIGFLKNNHLFILGRSDNVIVSGGENIDIQEVEMILISHPEIINVDLEVSNHKKWGQCIIANLVTNSHLTSEDFKKWCKLKMAPYKIPYKINISNKVTH